MPKNETVPVETSKNPLQTIDIGRFYQISLKIGTKLEKRCRNRNGNPINPGKIHDFLGIC